MAGLLSGRARPSASARSSSQRSWTARKPSRTVASSSLAAGAGDKAADARRQKLAKELDASDIETDRVAPALLPAYTEEHTKERQLTTKYLGNVR